MNFLSLNPCVHSCSMYESVFRTDECVSYDSKLIFVLGGDISAVVGGEKTGHIGFGGILYIPAGTPYKLKGKFFKGAVIGFDFTDRYGERFDLCPAEPSEFNAALCHDADIPGPFDKHILLEGCEAEAEKYERMCNLSVSCEGEFFARLSAMLKLELLRIAESVSENALPVRMVESLDAYIRENCKDEISNTEVGAIFGYHPYYISRVLKEKKGTTLRQYIISYRLKLAKRLLEVTGKTVNEIAEETGFTDASYFTKTFKGAFGATPKEYRNAFKDRFI